MQLIDKILNVIKQSGKPTPFVNLNTTESEKASTAFAAVETLFRSGKIDKFIHVRSSSNSVSVSEYWALRSDADAIVDAWEFETTPTRDKKETQK